MYLSKLDIENFRSIKRESIILENYICLVGPNGSGKSNILNALNIFFHNNEVNFNVSTLTEEDFFNKVTSEPIKITLEFIDLSTDAQEDFKAYYRNNKLRIFAEARWNEDNSRAIVKHFGERFVMKEFAKYFEADKENAYANELKEIYKNLKINYPDLANVTTKADMVNSLREFEEEHTDLCELLPSEDQFYGISRGANLLEKYIQWVYIPAVKDASTEQEEGRTAALTQLLDRTIRTRIDFSDEFADLKTSLESDYRKIIDGESKVLQGISTSLQARLREWSHPGTKLDLNWFYDPEKSISINEPIAKISIGENNFIGEITRSGHGLQRSFLISLLQELAMADDEESPRLFLGFEEPELYQHPPQARHIQRVLENLTERNTQVILSTHSPYFVSSEGFESIRRFSIARDTNATKISFTKLTDVSQLIGEAMDDEPLSPIGMTAKIEQIMQPSQNELYFSSVAILVEGIEDIAYISTHLLYKEKWHGFRKYGCHFVVCGGKTNLSRPLAIARALEIPVFVIFDADSDNESDNAKRDNIRDNSCILNLLNLADFDPIPKDTLWGKNLVMWSTRIGDEIRREYGYERWNSEFSTYVSDHGYSNVRPSKNCHVINGFLNTLYKNGWHSKLMEKLSNNLLSFAKNSLLYDA